jgi:hypothetical protein
MLRYLMAVAAVGTIAATGTAQSKGSESDMIDGIWHGWIQQTDQDSIAVRYDVHHWKKYLLITMQGRSGINYDMSDVTVKNDVATFEWGMGLGSFLYCRLSRRDGKTFEGTCDDRSPGESGKPVHVWITMSPPDGRGST